MLEQGHRVHAMARKLDARADRLRDMGAEVVVADMLDIHRCARRHARLLRGVIHDVDFATLPGSGRQRRGHCQEPGREGRVNLSQMTISEMSETETTIPQQKQHRLAEQMLRWSGLPVVYLRPTAFFDGLFLVEGRAASATTTSSACR